GGQRDGLTLVPEAGMIGIESEGAKPPVCGCHPGCPLTPEGTSRKGHCDPARGPRSSASLPVDVCIAIPLLVGPQYSTGRPLVGYKVGGACAVGEAQPRDQRTILHKSYRTLIIRLQLFVPRLLDSCYAIDRSQGRPRPGARLLRDGHPHRAGET